MRVGLFTVLRSLINDTFWTARLHELQDLILGLRMKYVPSYFISCDRAAEKPNLCLQLMDPAKRVSLSKLLEAKPGFQNAFLTEKRETKRSKIPVSLTSHAWSLCSRSLYLFRLHWRARFLSQSLRPSVRLCITCRNTQWILSQFGTVVSVLSVEQVSFWSVWVQCNVLLHIKHQT